MEMSHRGKEFIAITDKAEADLRSLLSIPDNYKVLFLQGGASTQFAAIPLNLAEEGDKADYVVTGAWSKKAIGEGKRFLLANAAATGDNKSIPDPSTWNLTEGAKYVHYCANETIGGVEFKVLFVGLGGRRGDGRGLDVGRGERDGSHGAWEGAFVGARPCRHDDQSQAHAMSASHQSMACEADLPQPSRPRTRATSPCPPTTPILPGSPQHGRRPPGRRHEQQLLRPPRGCVQVRCHLRR